MTKAQHYGDRISPLINMQGSKESVWGKPIVFGPGQALYKLIDKGEANEGMVKFRLVTRHY